MENVASGMYGRIKGPAVAMISKISGNNKVTT
jgi:hypothetical protein